MTITLEQIDELRRRANVSYNDAKEALEASNGNILDALVYLENHKDVNTKEKESVTFTEVVKKIIKKGNETDFMIKKENQNVLKVPVTVATGVAILAPHVAAIGVGISLVTGHKIRFKGQNGEDMKVNKAMDKVSNAVDNIKSSFNEKCESEGIKKEIL